MKFRLTEDMPLSTGEDTSVAPVIEQVTLLNPSRTAAVYVDMPEGKVRLGPAQTLRINKSDFNAAVRELVTSGTLVTR